MATIDPRRSYGRQRSTYQASLDLYRGNNDLATVAACLSEIASIERWWGGGEHAAAQAIAEALAAARQAGDEKALGLALSVAAMSAPGSDQMVVRAREALPLLHAVGDLKRATGLFSNIAYVALTQERHADALNSIEQGKVTPTNSATHSRSSSCALMKASSSYSSLKPTPRFETSREAVALRRDAGAESLAYEALLALAAARAASGQFESAARLVGAAQQHRPTNSAPDEERWSGPRFADS